MTMKILIICLFFGTFFSSGQTTQKTIKYAGLYDMGGDIEKGRVGSVMVYPETDSTILFYFDLNRGAPSYNSGELYGRLKVINGKGLFYWKSIDSEIGCKLGFQFSEKLLTVEHIQNQDACGFGFSVWANGEYLQKSTEIPVYFENPERTRIYFSKTTPEEYNKE